MELRKPKDRFSHAVILLVLMFGIVFLIAYLGDKVEFIKSFQYFYENLEWYAKAVYSIGLAIVGFGIGFIAMMLGDFIIKLIYTLCTTRKNR